jgi:hypothetical protein
MKKLAFLILVLTIVGCSNDQSSTKPTKKSKSGNAKIDLWNDVKEAEDSLYSKKNSNKAKNIHYMTYFSKLTEFYTKFPADPKADSCLFAICSTETGFPIGHAKHIKIQEQYGDTLILKYPKSKFRKMTIQNLVYMYDQSTKNRSTAKLNYYYKLLLADSLTTTVEKKEIEARLKTIEEPINFKKN